MKAGAARSGVGRAAAALLAAAVAGCATAERAGDPGAPGCMVAGVRVVGRPVAAAAGEADRGWPTDPARAVAARMAREDYRFRVRMDDLNSGRAYIPGLRSAEGARLSRTAGVEVEVIDDAEIFPVERDPYSRRAQLAVRWAELARFNRCLFRGLDRLGRIAP